MSELYETGLDDSTNDGEQQPELSRLMILLLKGVLYRQDDEHLWSGLLRLQTRVREQASVLLLDLVLDEAEGHAFLKSRPDPEDAGQGPRLPRLVARRPLSYSVSLMLALLRKRLAESDAEGSDSRLVITRESIAEQFRLFLPETSNEARLIDQIDSTLGRVADLGFVRKLKPATGAAQQEPHYEVRRIIKAFVDAQWLSDFDQQLAAYRTIASGTENSKEDAP